MAIADITQDPAYLMFLRTSGLAAAAENAKAAEDKARISTARELALQEQGDQFQKAREDTAGNYEARGVLKSGQYLKDAANLDKAQARAGALTALNSAQQMSDINYGLQSSALDRNIVGAELGLDLMSQQAQNQAGQDFLTAQGAQFPSLAPYTPSTSFTTPLAKKRATANQGLPTGPGYRVTGGRIT